MERLDKFISVSAGISRADARKYILKNKVTVDGVTVRDISKKVDEKNSAIALEGINLTFKKHIYLIMNKPGGVLSATEDKHKQTVIDLVPEELFRKDLFPVGRLDKDTTGLLLITDDGDFAHKLLSPKYKVPKVYIATLDGEITDGVIEGFEKGVTLADGTKLSSAKLKRTKENLKVEVSVIEGKYHQIKRMFGVYGLGVNALKRISFGGICLPKDLLEGQVRELSTQELDIVNSKKMG